MSWLYKIVLSAVVFGITTGCASSSKKSESSEQDETLVKNTFKSYVTDFNAHDVKKIAALWTPDATYIDVTSGEVIQGKAEIEASFKEQFQKQGNVSLKVDLEVVELQSQQPNMATVKGKSFITAPNQPESQAVFVAELTKSAASSTASSWLFHKVVELEIQQPSSHYEQLKELEWLVGKWGVKNDFIEFSSFIKWDENKNFLIQNFSLVVLGQKNISGQQIIGWDPIKKKIISWMFDSDGGYGEGTWTKQDSHWYVGMSFTLPNGKKASATQIYNKIDDRSFIFSSEDRDVGGALLPNSKPFTIHKM